MKWVSHETSLKSLFFYPVLLLLGVYLTNSRTIILVVNHYLLNGFCKFWYFILDIGYHFCVFFPHPVECFFSNYINLPPHPKLRRDVIDTMHVCVCVCSFYLFYYSLLALTHFSLVSHFYTPWEHQKTKGFLTFSGGIEMWHWTKMGIKLGI